MNDTLHAILYINRHTLYAGYIYTADRLLPMQYIPIQNVITVIVVVAEGVPPYCCSSVRPGSIGGILLRDLQDELIQTENARITVQ